jgi:hypothetical protein
MSDSAEGSDVSLSQVKNEAEKHMRLVETLEQLAHAEEDAAAAMVSLEMSQEADALLERAVEHYRWAAQVTQQATDERSLQHKLMSQAQKER